MSLEPPTSGNLPWMVTAETGEWIKFHVKQETLDKTENDKGWSCYTGEMKFPGEEYDDGEHEVPFWAMQEMFDAYIDHDQAKGWAYYRYKRKESQGKNTCVIEVYSK